MTLFFFLFSASFSHFSVIAQTGIIKYRSVFLCRNVIGAAQRYVALHPRMDTNTFKKPCCCRTTLQTKRCQVMILSAVLPLPREPHSVMQQQRIQDIASVIFTKEKYFPWGCNFISDRILCCFITSALRQASKKRWEPDQAHWITAGWVSLL